MMKNHCPESRIIE